MATAFVANSPEIAVESFEDGTVMINFLTGRYFWLNPLGDLIWLSLGDGATAAEISASIKSYGLSGTPEAAELTAQIEHFLDLLREHRLVAERLGERTAFTAPAVPHLTAYERPDVQVFDDLADLILLDPVHDVNEQFGWPVVRNAAVDG